MCQELLLHIRHAQSVGNLHDEDGRARLEMGTADYPLTDLGHKQARLTGEYVRARFGTFDVAFTSHYRRARETLHMLNVPAKKIIIEPLLAEANRGIWHIMPKAELAERYPDEIRRKKLEGLYHHRSLGGENNADIETRIALFQHRLAHEYAHKKVLVIVHGTWQLLFERRLYNQTPEEFIERYERKDVISNASIVVYRAPRRFLVGKRTSLVKTDYVIPWKGIIAGTREEIA